MLRVVSLLRYYSTVPLESLHLRDFRKYNFRLAKIKTLMHELG